MPDALLSPRYLTAVAYAEAGIPVFPCTVGNKSPATLHGFKDRTTDLAQIRQWWLTNDYNLAIVPDDLGCFVVDLDPKHNGIHNWQSLIRDRPVPPTRTILTPSGGLHLYFYDTSPRRPCAGRLGRGIDLRGAGSYVLIPPSVVGGVEYREQ